MIRTRLTAIAAVVLVASLSGCMPRDQSGVLTSSTPRGETAPVESELTWQEAKARTLAVQLEIARLIPENKVVKINDKKTGTLLGCSRTLFNWNGSTTVTLSKDAEMERVVKMIEEHYQDSRFKIKTRRDPAGNHEVQLRSPDTAEIYLIGEWDVDTIRIDSGSACFTLPEGVYPGGTF